MVLDPSPPPLHMTHCMIRWMRGYFYDMTRLVDDRIHWMHWYFNDSIRPSPKIDTALVTWHIHMWDKTHSCVGQDAFKCVTYIYIHDRILKRDSSKPRPFRTRTLSILAGKLVQRYQFCVCVCVSVCACVWSLVPRFCHEIAHTLAHTLWSIITWFDPIYIYI